MHGCAILYLVIYKSSLRPLQLEVRGSYSTFPTLPHAMQNKLLSLLLFAAFAAFTIATDEAPTSEFPKGLFAIENVYFPYYANVKNDSPEVR